jgi:hypothetical protein
MDIREAIAEADGLVRACSGLGDHRELRLMAASASGEAVISLGAIRALNSLAEVMTGISELEKLISLMAKVKEAQVSGRCELRCAPDVCRALASPASGDYRDVSPDVPASLVTGIVVVMMDHYDRGRWKLVRHDRCSVIGGETIEQAIIVGHDDCTVLGESP